MIEFIITSLIFYTLGRVSGREQEHIAKVRKKVKRLLNPPTTGAIDYPTAEASSYKGSEEEKSDEDRLRLQKEAGIHG